MKRRLIYLLPMLVALASGCLKSTENVPRVYPSGTYAGEFRRLHKRAGSTIIDTAKATIKIVFEPGVGYKVLGDTLTVHAGSKGHYGFATNANYVAFDDDTYPKTGIPAKTHLVGTYQYYYDGNSVLQMVANSLDTLSLQYDLKKVN